MTIKEKLEIHRQIEEENKSKYYRGILMIKENRK